MSSEKAQIWTLKESPVANYVTNIYLLYRMVYVLLCDNIYTYIYQ